MLAELDSISDPVERARFARGAVLAITRLTLSGRGRLAIHSRDGFVSAGERLYGLVSEGASMSSPTTRQLLSRHLVPFAFSLVLLTGLLLAQQASRFGARGLSSSEMIEALLLAIPFTLALTIPMSVFIAVSWVFTQLGSEGVLAEAQRRRHGVRRLILPVLGAAAIIGLFALYSNAQVVPRANVRFAAVLGDAPHELSDRTMTISQLREAASSARQASVPDGARHAAAYEAEIQKKLALSAACILLALVGAAFSVRFPGGGRKLVIGASSLVFMGYYVLIHAGESFADQQMASPVASMWMANAFLLALALLLVWRPTRSSSRAGGLAVGR
jgi:lipopolysaccharide export LptBFGC system permease protein LptF